eukprot:3219601-Rhodomonas_salina.1
MASDRVDAAAPLDTVTRIVAAPAAPALHRVVVSEDHSVASHAVCSTRARADAPDVPMPAPNTVNTTPALPCRFTRATPSMSALSKDSPSVKLPSVIPTDTATLKLPCTPPDDCLQTTVDEDTQSVASEDVPPSRASGDAVIIPSAWPTTVTLIEAVPATLLRTVFTIPKASIDKIAETLPICSPVVTMTLPLAWLPPAVMQAVALSDVHRVASEADPDPRDLPVKRPAPNPLPERATLTDPVAGAFEADSTLIMTRSTENNSDNEPKRETIVTATRNVVASHPDPPIRPDPEYDTAPSPFPVNDTSDDIDPALLPYSRPHTPPNPTPSIDIASVMLPTLPPAEMWTPMLPHRPCPTIDTTDSSDVHMVASVAVTPTLVALLR